MEPEYKFPEDFAEALKVDILISCGHAEGGEEWKDWHRQVYSKYHTRDGSGPALPYHVDVENIAADNIAFDMAKITPGYSEIQAWAFQVRFPSPGWFIKYSDGMQHLFISQETVDKLMLQVPVYTKYESD